MNVKDNDGFNPLLGALGRYEIVKLLIDNGADVNAKGDDGFTPLNAAKVKGLKEIADLLRNHGGKTGEELKAEGE